MADDDAQTRPVPYRGGGFSARPMRSVGVLTFAALVAVWELGSRYGYISNLVLPAPSEVIEAFRDLWVSGTLWEHLGASLYRLVTGWSLGTIAGIAVGFAIGLFRPVRASAGPLVAAIFPIPKIALLPLFIIWFGIGEASKVGLILFGTFFPTVIATYGGVDNVDRTLVRMGQSFGLSRWEIARKILFPGALPAILSGMRITAAIAIILIVAAELIAAQRGIGAYIQMAGSLFATDQLIAGVLVLSALGLTVSALIGALELWLLRWRA
ncbi:ABC transporter permease [Oricola cellulosilytica]|uniref:ABC transporter permease n=1 Tax=Oricola cellulosilytica TaxID=1429082 RepID=A0A4R0PH38_9HYPH|nr:ABC transporter permease [Oricola cellulosilytica]TCD16348.1 ABC transporter permease [Oricola cellulosilytica]